MAVWLRAGLCNKVKDSNGCSVVMQSYSGSERMMGNVHTFQDVNVCFKTTRSFLKVTDWIQLFVVNYSRVHNAENTFLTPSRAKGYKSNAFKTDCIYCTLELQSNNNVSPLLNCVRLLMHSLNFDWFLVVFTQFVLFVVAHSLYQNVQSYATLESIINMKSHVKRRPMLDTCCMP